MHRATERGATLLPGLALALGAFLACPAPARAQVFAEELRVKGLWPDLALALGAGFGLDRKLDTPVLGGARIGALYAYEPFVFALGLSGEVGALARRGVGAELELSHFGGLFVQAGFLRVRGADFMTHATLGFTIFGLRWQHGWGTLPSDALLFVVRVPVGMWWFLLHDDAVRSARARSRGKPDPKP